MRVSAVFGLFLLICAIAGVAATDSTYLVSVRTTTQSDMNSVADIVDVDPTSQQMIGVIEGTMSRVETMSADYQPTTVETPPTMTLIQSATFNADTSTWQFGYESIAADPTGELPAFKRVLYFSKKDVAVTGGDAGNSCLQTETTLAECISGLQTNYVVLDEFAGLDSATTSALTQDYIAQGTKSGVTEITSTHTVTAGTAIESIDIHFPHSAVQDVIGSQSSQLDSDGNAIPVGYKIGIGMLFLYDDATLSPMNIFDEFELLENNVDQTGISKVNRYSLARHVQFYLARPEPAEFQNLRLVKMEFQLEPGHTLVDTTPIRVSFNGNVLSFTDPSSECTTLMTTLGNANEQCSSPLTTMPLCTPSQNGDGSIISLIVPVPASIGESDTTPSLNIETSLETESGAGATPTLSILNINTPNEYLTVCKAAKVEQFDVVNYVKLQVFNKEADDTLAEMALDDADQTITFSTIQSLLVAVVRPDDTAAAQAFFTNYDKVISIDDAYMTHALTEESLEGLDDPQAVRTELGRSQLVFTSAYFTACPKETTADSIDGETCITTQDYGQLPSGAYGSIERPVSTGEYMHKIEYIGAFNADEYADSETITVQKDLHFVVFVSDTSQLQLFVGGVEQSIVTEASSFTNFQKTSIIFNQVHDAVDTYLQHTDADGNVKQIFIQVDETVAQNDQTWLQTVFGTNTAKMNEYHERVFATVASPRNACFYWMWPIYEWSESPLGLIDTTRIHLSWSVFDAPAAPSAAPTYRRLLSDETSLTHILRRVRHPYQPYKLHENEWLYNKARRSVESKQRRAQLRRYIERKLASGQALKTRRGGVE